MSPDEYRDSTEKAAQDVCIRPQHPRHQRTLHLLHRAESLSLRVRIVEDRVVIVGPENSETMDVVHQLVGLKPTILELADFYNLLGQVLLNEEADRLRTLATQFGLQLRWRRFHLGDMSHPTFGTWSEL